MTVSPISQREREGALVRKVAQTGDSQAFAQLMHPYERSLYGVLYSVLGGNEEDVLDARQEVLIAVYTSLKNYSGASSFHTWLYRLARNKGIDYLRKQKKEAQGSEGLDTQAAGGRSIEEQTEAQAAKEALWQVLRALKEEERSLYLMVEQDLLPLEEVGEVFDLPVGTVKSRLHRLREKILSKMKQGGWYEG